MHTHTHILNVYICTHTHVRLQLSLGANSMFDLCRNTYFILTRLLSVLKDCGLRIVAVGFCLDFGTSWLCLDGDLFVNITCINLERTLCHSVANN